MIRTVLATLALTLFAGPAAAMCMSGSLSVWPPADTALPTHPMIVLGGYGTDQATIKALGDSAHAELRADDHVIPLKVETLNTGEMNINQAVLRPARRLAADTRYALTIVHESGRTESPTQWSEGGSKPVIWTTAAGSDDTPPKWTAAPTVSGENYTRYGCGPASTVQVSAPIVDGSPTAIRVELREETPPDGQAVDGQIKSYILFPRDGELSIGHGMCSGAFRLTGSERTFVAELTAIDTGGNETEASTLIRFQGVTSGRRVID